MPRQFWWVKFENIPPERHSTEHFEEFWTRIRELMLRNMNLRLEWIIRD